MSNEPSYHGPQPAQYPQPAGQPPAAQPPPRGYPAPPRKKRTGKTLLITFGVVVLLCVGVGAIAAAVGGGGDDSTTTAAEEDNGSDNKRGDNGKVAAAGSAVRDGKFEFTVTATKCGATKVGNEYLNQKAQGQFCLITIKVKNIGKDARTLDASNMTAFDAKGAEFSADGVASMYANKDQETFLNEINPGNQVTAVFAFDVPKGTKVTKLELHDSPFSGGIQVAL